MKLLVLQPGASWSTADVDAGLRYGLAQHGVQIVQYRLDERIDRSKRWLHASWRRTRKANPTLEKPTVADIFYQAGVDSIAMALRHQVDAVLVVSGMFLHPDIAILMKRAGLHVCVYFTESPYDLDKELAFARRVDGCWTNERSVVKDFAQVNPCSGYLPHAWHPERHKPGFQATDGASPTHDVVFVGSAFRERIEWLAAIDWTGIDLGLYGNWSALPSRHPLRQFVRGNGPIPNATTAALYRRAKVGLNLYRTSMGFGKEAPQITHAESLNPRAYELAACGAFALSTYRAEVADVFGDCVPTFTTPDEASASIRHWLADAAGRKRIQAALPACVAASSWVERAAQVIGDIQSVLPQSTIARRAG